MAEIDRDRLAADVTAFLDARGYSYRDAVYVWPALNVATISRAVNRQVLSAANMLALCRCFDLAPFDYLVTTSRAASPPVAAGAPAGRPTTCDSHSALPAAPDGNQNSSGNPTVTAIVSRETSREKDGGRG